MSTYFWASMIVNLPPECPSPAAFLHAGNKQHNLGVTVQTCQLYLCLLFKSPTIFFCIKVNSNSRVHQRSSGITVVHFSLFGVNWCQRAEVIPMLYDLSPSLLSFLCTTQNVRHLGFYHPSKLWVEENTITHSR